MDVVTVGVDIGGARVETVVLDAGDGVLAETRMRCPSSGDRAATAEVIVAAIHDVLAQAGTSLTDTTCIGVGSPGVVVDGTVGQAANVPGWQERFHLDDLLNQRIDVPVRIVNDITAQAVAEHQLGAGRGLQNLLVVAVGNGVGGGLILDGRVYEGAFGAAGEFGHTVVERGGPVCPCGRRGCVEAYAGRHAMENAISRAVDAGKTTSVFRIAQDMGGGLSPAVFRRALDVGDPLIADLVDYGVEALGKGIASAVNLLDVEAVIVGGDLADELGPQWLGKVEAAARPSLFVQPPHVRITAAELGDRGGAIGAALLAREGTSTGRG